MNKLVILFGLMCMVFGLTIDNTTAQRPDLMPPATISPDYDKKLQSMLDFTVPVISVDQLEEMKDNVILLDAREPKEYKVSHIPGAILVGYDHWDKDMVSDLDRNKPVVLYCSVGYRSEKLGEKLQNMGFKRIYNLYGSIFEWANQNKPLVDSDDSPTREVHCYNKKWSKWMTNEDYKKVW